MKLFGYLVSAPEQQEPFEFSETTLLSNPAELREIAAFFLHAAENIEHIDTSFDHLQLSDVLRQFRNSPAFIVAVGESAQVG